MKQVEIKCAAGWYVIYSGADESVAEAVRLTHNIVDPMGVRVSPASGEFKVAIIEGGDMQVLPPIYCDFQQALLAAGLVAKAWGPKLPAGKSVAVVVA